MYHMCVLPGPTADCPDDIDLDPDADINAGAGWAEMTICLKIYKRTNACTWRSFNK